MRKFLLSIFVALSLSCESKIQVVEDDALNEDKNFSVFGNSISTYEGYIPSDYLTWFTPSKMKVEETWWYQVGESMGWELCNNSSWSGSRVAYDKDWDYNSYFISPYRLNNLSAKGTPDNILVLAGVNDWRWNISSLGTIESLDSTAFCGAYNLMLKRLKQLYPQANIYCISILPIREKGNTEETINSQGWSIAEANVCIKHICTNEGVTFFNMQECEYSNNVLAYTEDGLHPNVEGMRVIADYIVKALKEIRTTSALSNNTRRVNGNSNGIIYGIDGIRMESHAKGVVIQKNKNWKKLIIKR